MENATMDNATMENAMNEQMESIAERLGAAAAALERTMAAMEERHAHVYGDVQRIVATAEGAFGEQRDASRMELEQKLIVAEQRIAMLQAQLGDGAAGTGRRTTAAHAVPMVSKSGVDAVGNLEAGAIDAALSGLSLEQRIAVKAQLARAGLLS